MAHALSAIVGLGRSEISRSIFRPARLLAGDAVISAMADAQIGADGVDGLLLNQSSLAPAGALPLQMMDDIGLSDLRLLSVVEGKGSSVLQMIQLATMAIRQGMATTVACVFADDPVKPEKASGQSFQNESPMTGISGWEGKYGLFGPVGAYALAAKEYMHEFGISESQLGSYAMACREWASLNPHALIQKPLSIEEYLQSRYIAEPFRLFDCAFPVNGGMAVLVTDAERAGDFAKPPVYVQGMGQGHKTVSRIGGASSNAVTGGKIAAKGVYGMAGVGPKDVSLCEFYDPFSYCVIAALEDYGFCERGSAASFVDQGMTRPHGSLPVNTGGGQLASFYLQGMTPLSEAVIQARREGGLRQVSKNDLILVNGSGGRLEYHAALLLSPHKYLG